MIGAFVEILSQRPRDMLLRRGMGLAALLLVSSAASAQDSVRDRIRERLESRKDGRGDAAAPLLLQKGTEAREFEHAGKKRTHLLHLPPETAGKKPLPLVIVLHGMATNGAVTEKLTGFSALADQKGFAVSYPDGLDKIWRYWGKEDPEFVLAVADRLIAEGIADRRRVYCTGISNGAYLTNVLVDDHADRFAAAAAVAGTLLRTRGMRSRPSRPVPFLYVHGTEDPIVGYDGKDRFSNRAMSMSAESFVALRAKQNGCAEPPEKERLPDGPEDGGKTEVERRRYAPGQAGAETVFYRIEGGGHAWPGGPVQPERVLGKTSRDFNASEAMWGFFAKCALPEK